MSEVGMETTDWSPERKIVGAAVSVVILAVIQAIVNVDFPVGLEGAVAVIVGYFLPDKK